MSDHKPVAGAFVLQVSSGVLLDSLPGCLPAVLPQTTDNLCTTGGVAELQHCLLLLLSTAIKDQSLWTAWVDST
jgi:hypothetical protein